MSAPIARRPRVAMLVYNAFVADARVTKEALALRDAGHDVEVIAVLDRRTVPAEERDGISIVRIDRRPLHYRLLRTTRLVRRSLRLRRARTRRWVAVRRRRLDRRALWRRRPRLRPHLAAVHRRLPRGALVLGAAAVPVLRVYRALRWRLLRRIPALRARSAALPEWRRRRYAARFAEQRARLLAPPDALPPEGLGWSARLDQRVSRRAYTALMRLHKPLMYLDYYRRAYRHGLAGRFDVIHAHDLNTLPAAAALAWKTKVPLVYDAHELYPEVSTLSARERRVWRILEGRLIRRADRVLTVCESIAGELTQRYGVTPPRVVLNCPPRTARPAAIDPQLLRRKAGIDDREETLILYQGGFAVHRGLPELVQAMRSVSPAVLVLMGWGTLEEELRTLVDALELSDRVRIIEPVPQSELLAYTAGADVGVIPYRPVGLNNTYTTPNKLFEYIGAELPVLGTRLPELTRFIDGCGVGATFDPADPDDLPRALSWMVGDAELLAGMRDNARAVRDRFTWEAQSPVLLDAYRDLRR